MRYLSVCSGIEAATVAWHPLGWQPVGFSDIDPFPRALLQNRFGAVPVDFEQHRYDPTSDVIPLFGDFTQIQEHHVGPVDLLVGGTPCQSFSVAGKRLGLDDPRGNLAIEFLALAKRVRARWLAWENVPGVLSSWSGDTDGAPVDEDGRWTGDPRRGWEAELPETGDFHAFLELFRECGYRGCYRVLDAQYVRVAGLDRAVPQRRRRVFVIGHLGDDARAVPVLFDPESLRGNPAPRREAGQGFACDIVPCLTGSGVGTRSTGERGGQEPVVAERRGRWWDGSEVSQTLDAVLAKGQMMPEKNRFPCIVEPIAFPANLSGTQDVAESDVCVSLQSKNPTAVAFSCKDNGADATEDIAPTLRGMGFDKSHANGGGQMAVAFKAAHFTRGKDGAPSETAFALSADADMGDQDNLILAPGARPPAIAFALQTRIARNDRGQPEDICPTLNGADAGEISDSRPVVAYECKSFTVSQASNGFAWVDEVSPTIQARQGGPEDNTFSGVTDGRAVRRLTPRECERLQGFPDDWTLIPYGSKTAVDDDQLVYLQAAYPGLTRADAERLAADAPRYKAIGNSMAVNVMRWIGMRIQLVEDLLKGATE
jgi:DNA (cytosine-5)-methyltransferase 1